MNEERLRILLYNVITYVNDETMAAVPEEEVKTFWMEEIGITSEEYDDIINY